VSVLSAHMVGHNDYLNNVGEDRPNSVSLLIRFTGYVKCNPSVWLVESYNSHILQSSQQLFQRKHKQERTWRSFGPVPARMANVEGV